jgi:tetraacyldisaccharide 4'-kinase
VADALERGDAGACAKVASLAYGRVAAARLARDVGGRQERGQTIAVFGATLGGSWKTPLALALAEALAERGVPVGFLAHGYLAPGGLVHGSLARRVGSPSSTDGRLVLASDDPGEVGDEALLAARRLGALDVPVVIGRARDASWPRLAGRCVVADGGPGPRRPSSLRVLALDGPRPWGAGACPPAGDLRAPPPALEASADRIIRIWDEIGAPAAGPNDVTYALRLPEGLGGAAVGVITALARPGRFLSALDRRGVRPALHLELGDHAGPGAGRALEAMLARLPRRPDVLLTTEKCAIWLAPRVAGVPRLIVPCVLRPPASLIDALVVALGDLRWGGSHEVATFSPSPIRSSDQRSPELIGTAEGRSRPPS